MPCTLTFPLTPSAVPQIAAYWVPPLDGSSTIFGLVIGVGPVDVVARLLPDWNVQPDGGLGVVAPSQFS